jgi:hypothetical protein
MSRVKLFLVVAAVVAIGAAGYLVADPQQVGLRSAAGAPIMSGIPSELPPVTHGAMNINPVGESQSQLFFDDGTCESGLGAGTVVTDFVEFDVPSQCIQGGLELVAVTTRVNTGTMALFAWAQAGPDPPPIGAFPTAPIAPVVAIGPCPTNPTFFTQRALPAGVATITGTANFFAGLKGNAYNGRDANGPPAGRIWLLCSICGSTQYGPATLTSLGLGGNWMIRVTVEDANCVPVELMEFTID